MRLKTKIKLLIILLAVMAASLIAGCSIGEISIDEFLQQNGAKDQQVTYYANGGSFSGGISSIPVKYMYYRENVCITSDFGEEQTPISRAGYVFTGWYYVQLDEEGNPVYEDKENNLVKLSDTPVDFMRKIQKGEQWYVGAKWKRDDYVSYVLVCDKEVMVEDSAKNTYENGDEIYTGNFTGSTATVRGTTAPAQFTNATFLQTYYDKDCTRPVENYGSVSRPDDGSECVRVYAKYIEGNYTVVRDSSGVNSMFNLYSSEENMAFYLFNANESNEIDCSGVSFYPKSDEFRCKIVGNGYTLSHLNFVQNNISGGACFAMLGKLSDSASISDLTLKDVKITLTLRSGNANSALYLASVGMSEKATLENFVIDGVEMVISCPNSTDKITNLIYDTSTQTYSSDNLMFGGFDGTDEEFLASHTGIQVKNYEITVNVGGQTVLTEKNNQEADNE